MLLPLPFVPYPLTDSHNFLIFSEEKDEITRIPDFLYLILFLVEYIPVRMLKHPTDQTAIPSLHSHPFLLIVLNPAEMHSRMF